MRKPIPVLVRRTFLFFIATIPFEAMPIPPKGLLSVSKISGVLFFACCLWYPRTCFRRPAPAVLWFFGHLALLAVLGLFIPAELLGQLALRISTGLQLTIFFWVGSFLLQDTRLTRQTLFTFGASACALALGSLLKVPVLSATVHTGEVMRGGTRASALAYNPNHLAAVMAVAALMLIGLLLDNTRRTRARAWLLAFLPLPVLMLMIGTSSRGGLLAFVLGMLLFLVPLAPARRRIVALVLGVFALIALGAAVARDPMFAARLTRTFQERNVGARGDVYRAAWQLFLERPILGWGPVEFLHDLGERLNLPQRDPHSMFFWIVLEGGLVGALFFFEGVWLCIRAAWKSRAGPEGILPLALMVTVIVVNASGSWFAHKTFWVVLAIALASPVVREEWQRTVSLGSHRATGMR
jgi:O-antigen ligase